MQAWNVDTGKRVWTHNYEKSENWGPMLATAGGLVFSGGTNDRKFHAFDAATGKLLWEFPTNSGIIGQPSSFMVDGKQYVAVQSGWGIDSRGDAGAAQRRVARETFPRSPRAERSGCLRSSRRGFSPAHTSLHSPPRRVLASRSTAGEDSAASRLRLPVAGPRCEDVVGRSPASPHGRTCPG